MSDLIRKVMENSNREYADLTAVKWLVKKEIKERKYSEIYNNLVLIRKGLVAEGFEKKHIAFIGGSSVWWIESYLGVVTGCMTAVPLDKGFPGEELVELVNRADAEGVFLDVDKKDLADLIFDKCKAVKKIWLLDENEPEEAFASDNMENLAILKRVGEESEDVNGPEPDDIAMIMFTSGTTGKSKGVMLTQNNLASNLEAMSFSTAPGVVLLNVLPVHHAFCLVMDWLRGFARGAVICVNDSFMHMIRNMSIFQPQTMLMVPLMIETIFKRVNAVEDPEKRRETALQIFGGRMRYIFTGGAHLDDYYLDQFRDLDIKVLEGYGMSECSPVISANTPLDYKYGSVGKPLPNVEVSFSPAGEILVRGTSVMKQYYKMPEETSEVLRDGWLHTGDKGYMDEDGFLFLNGRIKNLIILSNGENVSPEELENKLGVCPLIGEIVVVGGKYGLVAVVYPDKAVAEQRGLDDEAVRAEIQKFLDEYNSTQPTYRSIAGLELRDKPFERSSTKKIKRDLVKI